MTDSSPDRLFALLPAIVRSRDVEAGSPLRDLLRVVSEQVDIVEDDIAGLYENWFIETAADWVVPYLGELVGYRPVSGAGDPTSAEPALARALVPRQEVANLIRAHRRKGTLALLEELGQDVAGWPARAVEFARLLVICAHLDFLHSDRGRVADLHDVDALELLDGPFDRLAHTVDVRRLGSAHSAGRYGIDNVGVWVWRTRTYPLVSSPAACLEEINPRLFTFSVLGNDGPIYRRPIAEPDDTTIATEAHLPVPLRRRALDADIPAEYGPDRTFSIEVGIRRGTGMARQPIPVDRLVVADLGDWRYRPRRGTVAVDPELGRIAFPPGHAPVAVWVDYRYGFSADLGGGPYPRRLAAAAPGTFHQLVTKTPPRPDGSVRSIAQALDQWEAVREDQPVCLIEVLDNQVYTESLSIVLYRGESIEIRAADRARPVLQLLDRTRNAPDALSISTPLPGQDPSADQDDEEPDPEAAYEGPPRDPGGCVRLDGLLITGRAVHLEGPLQRVEIVDCTLVPGWGLAGACEPARPAEPSLELYSCTGPVVIERSILGSIQVYADEVAADPVDLCLRDSILDATSDDREALGAPNWPLAHAVVRFSDCTVIGQVLTHAVLLGENTIFTGRIRVARSQIGCLRYCYVPPRSRTPRRHNCQPDLVEAALRTRAEWESMSSAERANALGAEQRRVVPVFTSERYGTPAYARLGPTCPAEILRGADDESELGAFHDLYQPQRLANLKARVDQFTPARTDSAVLVAD